MEPHNSGSPRAVKAICVPSGDQLPGQPGIDVPICETPLPSSFIKASTFPPLNRPVEKAILVPSGLRPGGRDEARNEAELGREGRGCGRRSRPRPPVDGSDGREDLVQGGAAV